MKHRDSKRSNVLVGVHNLGELDQIKMNSDEVKVPKVRGNKSKKLTITCFDSHVNQTLVNINQIDYYNL